MTSLRLLALTALAAGALSCSASPTTTGQGGDQTPGASTPTGAQGSNSSNGGSNGGSNTSNGSNGVNGDTVGSGGSTNNAPGATSNGNASNPGGGGTSTGGTPTSGGGSSGAPAATTTATSTSPPPNDPNTVTIKMTDFTVGPGQEIFMCQDFSNPFGGMDAAIGRSESDMTAGSHHLHVFYGADSPPVSPAAQCQNPFEFRSVLHIAGTPTLVTQYPAGMAAKLKGSLGLRLQVHYLNAGSSTLNASVVVKLTKVDPSTVKNWVAEIYFNRTVLSVPPGNGGTVATTCTVPSTYGTIGLIGAGSHMHSRGVHFVATTNKGTSLIDTTQWDAPPPVSYNPPVMLNPGDSISWTCTYDNTTGMTLTFGDSAVKNEMCIFVGRFYSAPDGNDIECQSQTPNGTGAVTNNIPQ